jgi:hypothetical protein
MLDPIQYEFWFFYYFSWPGAGSRSRNFDILAPALAKTSVSLQLWVHNTEYGYAPTSFANTWTKNLDRTEHEYNLRNFDSYTIPPPRMELFKKSPVHSLPFMFME